VVNPAGSGVIAVIEHFTVLDQDADACAFLGVSASEITGQSSQSGFGPFDVRALTSTATGPLLFRTLEAPVTGTLVFHANTGGANLTADMIPRGYPVILVPGTSCFVNVDATENDGIEFSVVARVRSLQPQELV